MRWPVEAATALGTICSVSGAGLLMAGAFGPWAQVTLFRNIEITLPGFLFVGGGICFAVSALVLLGGRRSPILCLLAALLVLGAVSRARRDVPHQVRHQLIGAQMAFFPVNRLLDQFHIDSIEVGGWRASNGSLLGPGIQWDIWGGGLLFLGGALGLSRDPLIVSLAMRRARLRCVSCGADWPAGRNAQFCPECGADTSTCRRCPACHTAAGPEDRYCIVCGAAILAQRL